MISEEEMERYGMIGQLVDQIHKLPKDRLVKLLIQLEREALEASSV